MSGMDIKDWTTDYYIVNRSACNVILEDLNTIKKIPSLNCLSLDDLRDGQLVRFQGMIQDMHNPDYYLENYEVKNTQTGESYMKCGMYKDIITCLTNEELIPDSSKNKRSERQTCIVITVPGLNEWAKEVKPASEKNSNPSCGNSAKKRSCNDNEEEPMEISNNSEPVLKKKKSDEKEAQPGASNEAKKTVMVVSKEHLLNFPIPIDDGKACIVRIYMESTTFKLNQIVDIVGFIDLNPMLASLANSNNDEMMEDIEVHTHNPPASIIPRLHAVTIKELSSIQCIPIQPEIMSKAKMIRSDLHMILSQLLFGDNLAADFLICHLISSIYTRKDYLCLGNFPLNITNFPEKFTTFPNDFYNFLTKLIAKSHYLECTLDALNDLSMVPKKDYDSNRLTSGILQLSDNTHLIIDESNLTSGQVSSSGRLNYEAIGDIIKFQKLTYDFKYYTIEYETDIPVLILSQVKSFIPCVMQILLKSDPETESVYSQVVEAANQYLLSENRLNDIRNYLEFCRKGAFALGEDISNVIQEDFIQLRKSDKSVNADNLHSLIVLARLMALSHGENSLTVERWKQAFEIEVERMSRLPQRK